MDTIHSFVKILGDWPISTVGGTLLISVLILIITYGLLIASNLWFQPKKSAVGKVVKKGFIPSHSQLFLMDHMYTEETSFPHLITIPDEWSVSVEVEGCVGSICVNKESYDKVSVNDKVLAEYVCGRFSKDFYLKKFSPLPL